MAIKKVRKTLSKQTKLPEQREPDKDTKAEEVEVEVVKPRHYRKAAREEIEKTYKTIVAKLATEATNGSVRHTKLLFDLGGVQEEAEATSSKRRKSPSLGKILLKEAEAMKKAEEKSANDVDQNK